MSGIFSPTVPKRNNPYDSICEWIRGAVEKLNAQRMPVQAHTTKGVLLETVFVALEDCTIESLTYICSRPAEVATSATVLKSAGGDAPSAGGLTLHASGSINLCEQPLSPQSVQLTSDTGVLKLSAGDRLVVAYSAENSGSGSLFMSLRRS